MSGAQPESGANVKKATGGSRTSMVPETASIHPKTVLATKSIS